MKIPIRLEPLGIVAPVDEGGSLMDVLTPYGVEFPCGGAGTCEGCRVFVKGRGWELACQLRATEPMSLEVEQWQTPVLSDSIRLRAGKRSGRGVAVDLGSTTIVAQLVDLATGDVLDVRTAVNPQTAYGSDVMSRIEYALHSDTLTGLIRAAVGEMSRYDDVTETVIVGNTAMHHLYLGLPVRALAAVPFRSPFLKEQREGRVRFLRCLGGFVGSDILAGIAATGLHRADKLAALIDLGTNGEIVVGHSGRLVCCSTAAGPAFGIRAATGAIAHVGPGPVCRTIGGAPPRGLCGSGLVDAVAVGLNSGTIAGNGRLSQPFPLAGEVSLTQRNVRDLQLAKGAIAAGLRILLTTMGACLDDLATIYLAGAFGNFVDVRNAIRIGLLPPVAPDRVHPCGNTALRGARMILLDPESEPDVFIEHLELAADPEFQDEFAGALPFPKAEPNDQKRTHSRSTSAPRA